jgi:hypothetical protein
MKALILILALLPLTAFAEKPSFKDCTAFSNLAELFMESRQRGIDIVTSYENAGDNKVFQMLVTAAYSESRFSIKIYQDKRIAEFKNKAFLYCMK